jgi:ABC-type siderophore export system fused ATPase/permease subunit
MHEALFPSHDELNRQLEIAKRLRREFLHQAASETARAVRKRRRSRGGKTMRARHAFAIAATILAAIGLKFYFSPHVAEAEVAGMDIAAMQAAALPTMPRQEINDMAFGP